MNIDNYFYDFTHTPIKGEPPVRRGCVDLRRLEHWSTFLDDEVILYFSGDSILVDRTPELMDMIKNIFELRKQELRLKWVYTPRN